MAVAITYLRIALMGKRMFHGFHFVLIIPNALHDCAHTENIPLPIRNITYDDERLTTIDRQC